LGLVPAIEPFYRGMGKRIQEARERAGLTQEQLGRRLTPPMTRASIANIESAKQRVLCHTLVALCDVLSVPTSEILIASESAGTIEAELKRKLGRTASARVLSKLQGLRT
jgi:transcriptional regulator with XRE-family HTH domain